ncbi:extracellular solute-binding protein [Rhodococcus rhodnii]|uniref:ABC sugar transporter n=2 Tax=Rhodococcus rhodnii TaxID=38312 RepID=R7WPS8_9NOCA|nr:extracellular solute-binding protein [Rhodococcus rhodnii]EOM77312.1 ABC sugar transporter [Rhodococcus rhodnii LMG 5362]TXG91695.1 extracellular solute-binding protein [Rhodococcus rhodnii]
MSTTVRTVLTALSAAAVLATAGCATGTTTAATGSGDPVPELSADQQVEITFESYNLLQAGAWSDTVHSLIDEFEAQHPNISVQAQPTQGGSTDNGATASSVQTQLLAGNPPDVAQLTFDALDFTVNELGAVPVDAIAGADVVDEHLGGEHPFHPNAAGLADWEGTTVGIPYVFSTPVLFYNASVLEAAGLPTDTDLSTWDAVADAARAATEHLGRPALTVSCAVKGGNWCMQGLFRSAGGAVLSDDRETIEFASDDSLDAVHMLRELYDEGVLENASSATMMESFGKGQSAIQLQTSALQSSYLAAADAGGWELRAAAMPAFDGKDAVPTNSGSALFVFSQDPAEQRAAWELISFLTSDHAYEKISTGIGYLPLRTSLTEDGGALKDWVDSLPVVRPNLDQLDTMEPWTSYPGNSYVQVDTVLADAIEQSVFYGKDPEATMRAAAERAQQLIS